jgi:hypothetical protein
MVARELLSVQIEQLKTSLFIRKANGTSTEYLGYNHFTNSPCRNAGSHAAGGGFASPA